MGITYPSLSAGSPVDNLELDTNFSDVVSMLQALAAENMADDAGIRSEQLADRFCIVPQTIHYFPRVGATSSLANFVDLSQTPAEWTMPNVTASPGEEFDRTAAFFLRDGRAAYLAAATARAQAVTPGAGPSAPVFWLSHNGTVLGGGGLTIAAADTDYSMAAMNPYDSRQRSIQSGDYFTFGFGRSAAAAPTMRNLVVTLFWFLELSSG